MPWVGMLLAVVVLIGFGVGHLGGRAVARAEAQAAADAAALAGVFEGRAGAADLAGRNGAELVAFNDVDGVVSVDVIVAGVTARAWARFEWVGTS